MFFSVLDCLDKYVEGHQLATTTGLRDPPQLPPSLPPATFPPVPPTTTSNVGLQQLPATSSAQVVPSGAFAPIVGTTNVSIFSDGIGYDRRMLFSKIFFYDSIAWFLCQST